MPPDRLRTYRAKRDFDSTPEPAGDGAAGGAGSETGRFVVQEHHATRLHWDLRLEHNGALASWAIPNGIPQDPSDNRLAVHTEDHPLEYLEFHGEIPAGEYGAGTMSIWDRGMYETHKWRDDKVEVTFHGERVRGRYGLFPIGRRADGSGGDQDWMIHRMDPPDDPDREPMPERILPMLADARPDVPRSESQWSFEVKWDGVRAIAYLRPGRLRLESRNLNEITDAYPEVRGILLDAGMHEMVLDGEIVAFGENGRPSFERLQRRMHVTAPSAVRRLSRSTPVVYAIFDLLYLDGHSLMARPYQERRARLDGLGLGGPAWRVPAAHPGRGAALYEATREQGLEGIVAKRLDSRYEPGRRTGAWLKIKHTYRQELIVCGWLPGEGRRTDRIGALLMGYRQDGSLRYAGRVGTGFTERTLTDLARRLEPLRSGENPYDLAPKLPANAVFVRPELVAEIEFREWTGEGVMRAPSFKGLRDDKPAVEVVREPLGAVADTPGAVGDPPGAVADTPGAVGDPPGAVGDPPGAAAAPPDATEAADGGRVAPEDLFDTVERLPDGALMVVTEDRELKLTNWDKVLFPAAGFTKGDLIAYYARVAPAVVPHLRDRPLTLKRYPNGVDAPYFYEKQAPSHRPEWVRSARMGSIEYVLAQDRPTLIWLANLADVELHTSLAFAARPDEPTMLVFDLDPGAPADIVQCAEVALVLRGLFAALGLESVAKASGSKGMQLYVPLNSRATYGQTKPFARRIAELLEQRLPELVVSRMTKRLREGKVLVDWSQNDDHKTTVTVYSVRARERPTVSAPVSWEEVQRCLDSRDPELLSFETGEVLARAERDGDPFAMLLSTVQELPAH